MTRLLKVRDWVLLSAAAAGDIFNTLPIESYSSSVRRLSSYGFLPSNKKRSSYMSEVSRLLRVGDINKKVDKNGKVFLELTSKGKQNFKRRFSLLVMSSKKWDGEFMIVSFDIPEKESRSRNILRRKLSELGFGMFQRSVWMSAYHFEEDMREFAENKGFGKEVVVFSARKLFGEDTKVMANRIWKLDKLNKKYRKVLRLTHKIDSTHKRSAGPLLRKARNVYIKALISDPLLPKELLANDWLREKALNTLKDAADK